MKAGNSSTGFGDLRQQERIAYLLAAHFSHDLNDQEEQELARWIAADSLNQQLFEELCNEDQISAYLKWYGTVNVESRLEETRKKLARKKIMPATERWKYVAAAIVIIGGIAIFFWKLSGPVSKPAAIIPLKSEGKYPVLKTGINAPAIFLQDRDTLIAKGISFRDGVLVYSNNETREQHQVIVPRKALAKIALADETRVWLNDASSISYPASFAGPTREVTVTGETYFEIAKDAARPFIVAVNDIRITATGTAFNIKAYPGMPVNISLTEGSAKVAGNGQSKDLRTKEHLQITTSGNWRVTKMEEADPVAWKNNKLMLKDANAVELKQDLERWFDVTVILKDTIDKHFNGTFPRDINLMRLLETLEKTNDIRFHVDGNRITVLK
ncbi:MAG: FecR domain-containing protein [Chitinophagaceae bacterium]